MNERERIIHLWFDMWLKQQDFSDFLLGVPLCKRRVFSCESSGQVDPM